MFPVFRATAIGLTVVCVLACTSTASRCQPINQPGNSWSSGAGSELDPGRPITERLPAIDLPTRMQAETAADGLAAEASAEIARQRFSNAAKLLRARIQQAMGWAPVKYQYFIRELNEQLEKRHVLSALGLHQHPHAAVTAEQFAAERALYGNRTLPAAVLAMIRTEAIQQGDISDCWFLSTLAVVVNEYPYLVPSAITTNSDGSYTVSFRGDRSHPVTVPPLAAVPGGVHLTPYGRWPEVLENAAFQLFPDDVKNGGYPAQALKLLTGLDATIYTLSPVPGRRMLTPEELSEVVIQALDTNTIVMMATNPSDYGGHEPGPFVPNHAYSIVAYVPANQAQGAQIVVRNPWGGTRRGDLAPYVVAEGDGRLRVPVAELYRYFEWVTIAAGSATPSGTLASRMVLPRAQDNAAGVTNTAVAPEQQALPAVPTSYITARPDNRALPAVPMTYINSSARRYRRAPPPSRPIRQH